MNGECNVNVFKNFFCVLVISGILTAVSGCREAIEQAREAAQADRSSEGMKIMGRTFHDYNDVHSQFPGSWDELIAFETEQGQHAEVFEQLRDDGCVVTGWGLKFRDIIIGSSCESRKSRVFRNRRLWK